MKLTFISAGLNRSLDEREERLAIASFPPLGILYLATILRERGVEVSVLDQAAKGFTAEQTVKWIERESPDIVGFSALSSSGQMAAMINGKIKERNPNIVSIFGNHYATFNSERILRKYPSIDIVVRGEGEDTVPELINCLSNGDELREVRGISFRSEGRIISTPDRPLITDLDSVPFPDRRFLDVEYHCTISGINVAPKKFTSIASSRGCVYNCRFCSCRKSARNLWRARSVRNILEELLLLTGEGYKQFIFVDDCFTLNQKRVIELCRAMRRERMDVDWICEGRVDNFSYEMSWEMAKAGCKILYFGIESANQRILDYYNKKITPLQSKTAVKTARKAGVDVIVGSFIVGAPDETREEIQNTLEFARQIPIDVPDYNILGVYPGMDIWDELEAKGLLKGEYWETGVAVPEICPTAVPLNEIRQMARGAFYDFIRRPDYIIRQIARILKSTYLKELLMDNLSRADAIVEDARSVI
jgi:radical SAM superfamily enzyme YgiQ (UPF0313 family)